MSRWIDADALAHKVAINGDVDFINKVTKLMIDTPSIDIEPKRGEWVLSSDGYGYIGNPVYKCSVCGWWDEQTPYNFCPNCGADMREREDK